MPLPQKICESVTSSAGQRRACIELPLGCRPRKSDLPSPDGWDQYSAAALQPMSVQMSPIFLFRSVHSPQPFVLSVASAPRPVLNPLILLLRVSRNGVSQALLLCHALLSGPRIGLH